MGTRGTDPFVEQVRLATDILGIVSGYVEMQKAGKRWKGRCPFHAEKTPSFFVSQENQTFYCFGCQKGGDVFSFVMEQETLTFPEALRMLADKAGIEMPRRRWDGEKGIDDRLGEALEVAASFYQKQLGSTDGARAREYLAERGIGEEMIERFGLGWAPASWDALLRHAGRLLPERVLIKAGLEIEGERGLYDRFRERVIIPIQTAGGRTVAFGGRLLGPGEPKYLNSPETPLYKKGTVVFGMREARESIREAASVVIVEGYFDVIALSEAGIGWSVGTCGTAFTPDQAALLRRFSESWTFLFDGDGAGRSAVLRALEAAIPVHSGVRVAICPQGLDPDSWIRQEGADRVREALESALTPLQYLEEQSRAEAWDSEETLARVAKLLRGISEPMVRDLWIQEAAGRFRVRERAILAAVGSRTEPARPRQASPERSPSGSSMPAKERQIVSGAVQSPAMAAVLLEACQEIPNISATCKQVLEWIRQRHDEGIIDAAALLSRASEDGPEIMTTLSFLHDEAAQMDQVPPDLVQRLRRWGVRRKMQDLTDQIRRTEERGESIGEMLQQKQELAQRLRDLDAVEEVEGGNFL